VSAPSFSLFLQFCSVLEFDFSEHHRTNEKQETPGPGTPADDFKAKDLFVSGSRQALMTDIKRVSMLKLEGAA